MPPIQVTVEFIVASSLAALLLILWIRAGVVGRRVRRRFSAIVSVDAEVERLRKECSDLEARRQQVVTEVERDAEAARIRKSELEKELMAASDEAQRKQEQLKSSYAESQAIYDQLLSAIREVEEDRDNLEIGLYKPHFNFDDSEAYKSAVDACRAEVKRAIKNDGAIVVAGKWTVEGSESKGARLQKQYGDVMLRAFNGECDAAIANVTWKNITKLESRLEKSFEAINRLGTVMQIKLNTYYLGLRLRELRLAFEHACKKNEEAEEQRRIREQMREEERVQRELEKEKQEADADEKRYQRALERAREEAARAKGAEVDELGAKIRELEKNLADAHARSERAVSQAQLTKSGHVYVISNIGSFGSDVMKIGMTRRLEPLDRVRELGDASVPFAFDVHAMIYSEDAPALESQLHRKFSETRVNLVNERKEFFRVDLQAIAVFVESLGLKAEMTLVAQAQEYRETLARRNGVPATAGQG